MYGSGSVCSWVGARRRRAWGLRDCRHLFKNYIRKKGTRGTPSKIQLVFESTPKNAPRLPIQNQQSYHT